MLSDQEIKYLIEKAEACIISRNFKQAVSCYSQIIKNTLPHPYYFYERACAYACIACAHETLNDLNKAIQDISMAIELDTQNGIYYWRRGTFMSYSLTIDKEMHQENKDKLLKKIIDNYKSSKEKNPSNPKLWLDLIETNLISQSWDDAVGNYGDCVPYIDLKEDRLIRAWLGCIALIFSDEQLNEEDVKILHDKEIFLNRNDWYVGHIEHVLNEVKGKDGSQEKYKKAKEIHELFLSHWSEMPW